MKPHPSRPPSAAQPPVSQPPDPVAVLRQAALTREAAGLGRRLNARAARPGAPARVPGGPGGMFDGPPGGIVDLASNDYLGLCGDERLAEAAAAAARTWGTGSTGSRLVTGTTELHIQLERDLAEFTGAAGALVFSSGYLANLAVITALGQVLGQEPALGRFSRRKGPGTDGPALACSSSPTPRTTPR